MANMKRVESRKILNDARAREIAETGEMDDGLLKSAGMSTEDIGRLRLNQHKAEQLAKFRAEHNGSRSNWSG